MVVGDEELLERRHGLAGEVAQLVGADRDLAPAEYAEGLGDGDRLDRALHGGALVVVDREEPDADGVVARGGKLEGHDGAEERVGDLHQDPGAVACSGVGPDGPAVLEVAQGTQGGVDDVVTRSASQRRDHGKAAGVLLVGGVVETLTARDAAESLVRWRESHVDPSSRCGTAP